MLLFRFWLLLFKKLFLKNHKIKAAKSIFKNKRHLMKSIKSSFSIKPNYRPQFSKIVTSLFTFFIIIFFGGCKTETQFPKLELSNIAIDEPILNLEDRFFITDSLVLADSLINFANQNPQIADLYFNQLLSLGNTQNQKFVESAVLLFNNPEIVKLKDTIDLYKNQFKIELNKLESGLKHFKHYFPNKTTPKIFTAITEFGPSAFTLDTLVAGISLDMYLGSKFVFYPSVGFYQYQIRNFKPTFLPTNTLKAIYQAHFPNNNKTTSFINTAIHNGKLLYLLDVTLPETQDYIKIGYLPEHIDWCKNNEGRIWGFFIENELLYATQSKLYGKYVNDGPTSSGMPPESPGNIGTWVGWQIVRAFMQQHPNFPLQKLMEIEDGQYILSKSKYKPKQAMF